MSLLCTLLQFCLQYIKIYLKNDHAMIIRYYVGNLGEIKFCLAPKHTNDDDIYEDDM